MKKKLENALLLVGLIILVLGSFAVPILATCSIVFNWAFIFKWEFCMLTAFEIIIVIGLTYLEIKED